MKLFTDLDYRLKTYHMMQISQTVSMLSTNCVRILNILLELLVFSYLVGILFFQRSVFLFVNVAFNSGMNNLKG